MEAIGSQILFEKGETCHEGIRVGSRVDDATFVTEEGWVGISCRRSGYLGGLPGKQVEHHDRGGSGGRLEGIVGDVAIASAADGRITGINPILWRHQDRGLAAVQVQR